MAEGGAELLRRELGTALLHLAVVCTMFFSARPTEKHHGLHTLNHTHLITSKVFTLDPVCLCWSAFTLITAAGTQQVVVCFSCE